MKSRYKSVQGWFHGFMTVHPCSCSAIFSVWLLPSWLSDESWPPGIIFAFWQRAKEWSEQTTEPLSRSFPELLPRSFCRPQFGMVASSCKRGCKVEFFSKLQVKNRGYVNRKGENCYRGENYPNLSFHVLMKITNSENRPHSISCHWWELIPCILLFGISLQNKANSELLSRGQNRIIEKRSGR